MVALFIWKLLYLRFRNLLLPPSVEIGSSGIRIIPLSNIGNGPAAPEAFQRVGQPHVSFTNVLPFRVEASASGLDPPSVTFANEAPPCPEGASASASELSMALVPYDAVGPPLLPKVYGRSVTGRILPMSIDEVLKGAPSRYSVAFR
jgi:hypothetical protein